MKLFLIFIFTSLISIAGNAQDSTHGKFFITTGYGLAGSFFVRSYDEFIPTSNYKIYQKKNFIGNAQNAAIGYKLRNNWDVRFGINFQHFTRHIDTRDTLSGVLLINYGTIHHRDYMWYGSVHKSYHRKKHALSGGMGLFYFRPKQQEIDIIQPRFYSNIERDIHRGNLEEGGAFIEFAYEYDFQPKVKLGVKTQFYYTLSTGTPESVTLMPTIKILF